MTASDVLTRVATLFAPTVVDAVQQEYPNAPRHVMRHPDDRPAPREIHPAFYGCFDWHSAVEMHWALAVLARDSPGEVPPEARAVLTRHLTAANLRTEAEYLAANPSFERPYGWGWALQLADELADWADAGDDEAGESAAEWAQNLAPLAEAVEAGFVAWLPKPAYPDRTGMHSNSAFALARALPWARRRAAAGEPALLDAIGTAADRWFGRDTEYSSQFEPSGSDFLSPTLTEVVLMHSLYPPDAFQQWHEGFNGASLPSALAFPARVTDAADGQGAHLHGLNLYRVHAFRHLADRTDDARFREELNQARERHLDAATAALSAEGWMSQHWLAAFGVLAFR